MVWIISGNIERSVSVSEPQSEMIALRSPWTCCIFGSQRPILLGLRRRDLPDALERLRLARLEWRRGHRGD